MLKAEDVERVNWVLEGIERVVKQTLGNEVNIVLYGSVTTGLATRDDFDLDITVVTKDVYEDVDAQKFADD